MLGKVGAFRWLNPPFGTFKLALSMTTADRNQRQDLKIVSCHFGEICNYVTARKEMAKPDCPNSVTELSDRFYLHLPYVGKVCTVGKVFKAVT